MSEDRAAELAREILEGIKNEYDDQLVEQVAALLRPHLSERPGWISIADRLPKEKEYVLWAKGTDMAVDSIRVLGEGMSEHPEDYFTHWLSLPSPPKERP